MSVGEAKIRTLGKANDLKRRLLADPRGLNKRCFLLERAGETKRFNIISELTTGWKVYWSEFRGQMVLEHATLDSAFDDFYARTSYVAYGEPGGQFGNMVDLYSIDPNRLQFDMVPPTTESPTWKVAFTRVPKERFTIPS